MGSTGGRGAGSPHAAAASFVAARRGAQALDAYPGRPPLTLDEGYAVQEAAIPLWPAPVVGWKLGRIAPPLDVRLGCDRVAGPVFADGVAPSDGQTLDVPVIAGGFAAVEAEYVLRIGRSPPPGRPDLSPEEAASLVDAMLIGVEMAGSGLPSINALGPTVVAADFGNHAGLIVGPEIEGWRDRPVASLTCETWIDGERVGEGGAERIPGGPLDALRALVGILARRGRTLAPGDLVTTGAATGIHDIVAGQSAEVRFGRDGIIRLRAVPAEAR